MKPLELAAYPICDCGPPDHYIDCDKTPTPAWLADLRAEDKRLTDAELAAELWKSGCQASLLEQSSRPLTANQEYERGETLLRFANTPSYDE